MSAELAVFLGLIGAALVMAAVLAGRIFGSAARTTGGLIVRTVVGIGGCALAAWTVASLIMVDLHREAATAPLAATAPAAAGSPVPMANRQLENCSMPNPPVVPDAITATQAQMLTARAQFATYDAAINSYVHCVDATIDQVTQQFPGASALELQALKSLGISAHNTAIDQEQALADRFNAQVRAYQAKHPG